MQLIFFLKQTLIRTAKEKKAFSWKLINKIGVREAVIGLPEGQDEASFVTGLELLVWADY